MNQLSSSSASTVGSAGLLSVLDAPKVLFLAAAGISFCLSVWLWFSFLAMAGAYIAVRRRANEAPVHSYAPQEPNYPPTAPAEHRL